MDQLDWNLARAFSATAEAGSLSAAARRLGLTQPTLSRQIASLEVALGSTLFDRVGKRLVLTPTGEDLLDHARAMAAAADALSLAAAGRSQDVEGRVTISASDAISAHLLPEIICKIGSRVPQVTFVIVASNAFSDLRRREADIALRHARPTEQELISRLVCQMQAHFYASSEWVSKYGLPASVEALGECRLLGFEPIDRFCEHLQSAGVPVQPKQFRIVSESSVVLWEMVRLGMGVGMMLDEIATRTPGVVRLLLDHPGTPVPLWLVSHRELRTSRRVRIVFDALAEELSALGRG